MNKSKIIGVFSMVVIGLVLIGFSIFMVNEKETTEEVSKKDTLDTSSTLFERDNLSTNTSKKSLELKDVLDGGPGKDGIPAIFDPKFYGVVSALETENKEINGIAISKDEQTKFYPYSILVWHEIVNDKIADEDVLVTFCPLCGSAIVFDPTVNGKAEKFGVSGKLWQSNLLMYDKTTESLWSQIVGEAVVGDHTGKKLGIFPSQVMTLEEFSIKYPAGEVMTRDTGENRNYDRYPYGDYNTNETMYFPVLINDARLPTKEVMYAVNFEDKAVAFSRKDVLSNDGAEVDVNGKKLTVTVGGSEIIVKNPEGKIIPGFNAMWFSWASHHQEDGVVWSKN